MSEQLTIEIVSHIFSNLGILANRQVSILSKDYLTNLHLKYETCETNIWACETNVNNTEIRIMCSYNNSFPDGDDLILEANMIIKLDGCPVYGCNYYRSKENEFGSIAFTIEENIWVKSTISIQATFLAGMEAMKDLAAPFKKCKNNDDLFKDLKNFIKFLENTQE